MILAWSREAVAISSKMTDAGKINQAMIQNILGMHNHI